MVIIRQPWPRRATTARTTNCWAKTQTAIIERPVGWMSSGYSPDGACMVTHSHIPPTSPAIGVASNLQHCRLFRFSARRFLNGSILYPYVLLAFKFLSALYAVLGFLQLWPNYHLQVEWLARPTAVWENPGSSSQWLFAASYCLSNINIRVVPLNFSALSSSKSAKHDIWPLSY